MPSSSDILEHLPFAVVVLDDRRQIVAVNPQSEDLLGVSRTRLIGRAITDVIHSDEAFINALHQVQTTGAPIAWESTLAGPTDDATERHVECQAAQIYREGEAAHVVLSLADVTRRARISREHALLLQHGAGRQMVRQLAHEIKNPLGGLRGAAQLLGRELPDGSLQEYTDVIISEADRLVALVDSLLGPGGPLTMAPANIHELLERVLTLVASEAGDGLVIHRQYDPGLPEIQLDRDQMVQALLNLARNAVTAMGGNGNLTVRTRAEYSVTIGDVRHAVVAVIDVEDDGSGIPPELQDSVFYPLVTGRVDGTGLGLPTAQELVNRHGGLIEFDSRPGRTVFTVRVPLADGRLA